MVARVKDHFTSWQQRPLTDARYPMLFLDAIHLRVRLAGRVISVPVLAALGVTDDGQKQLVTLPLAAAEATASWGGLTQASFSTEAAALTVPFGLVAVGQIVFRKIDGHHDLAAFLVKEQWSQAA